MKKILFVVLFSVLGCSLAFAGGGITVQGGTLVGGGSTAAAPSNFCDDKGSYALCEDFDSDTLCETSKTSTCRNTWTSADCAGTKTYNYTADVLAGTYSLYVDESASGNNCTTTSPSIGTQSSIFMYARIKINTLNIASAASTAFLGTIGDRCNAGFTNSGGTLYFAVYNGSWNTGTTTPATGTEYDIWLEHIQNTSCKLYVSTTSTKPETEELSLSGVNSTDTGIKVRVLDGATSDADQMLFDNILISTSAPIGSM